MINRAPAYFGLLAVAVFTCSLSTQAFAAATQQAPAASVCSQAIQSLKSEWKVVDYPTHVKATTTQVEGRFGHQNTPAQIAYMKNEIKKAEAECASGNRQSALQRVSAVQDVLDIHGNTQQTANAAMIQR